MHVPASRIPLRVCSTHHESASSREKNGKGGGWATGGPISFRFLWAPRVQTPAHHMSFQHKKSVFDQPCAVVLKNQKGKPAVLFFFSVLVHTTRMDNCTAQAGVWIILYYGRTKVKGHFSKFKNRSKYNILWHIKYIFLAENFTRCSQNVVNHVIKIPKSENDVWLAFCFSKVSIYFCHHSIKCHLGLGC